MYKNKPDDVREFHYEAVSILINDYIQVTITLEPVGGTNMFVVMKCDRTRSIPTRDPSGSPMQLETVGVYQFYGKALLEARALVGWDWEPHPDKPKDMP